jgi:hypothetical protein
MTGPACVGDCQQGHRHCTSWQACGQPTVIALTGDPVAQDAVGLQLAALSTERKVPLRLFLGVTNVEEADRVDECGGELWHCGPGAQLPALSGRVHRVLSGRSFDEIAPAVAACLVDLMVKQRLLGGAA